MTCEEFQMADLDSGLTAEEGPLQQAARQHLLECPHCAALHENWQALRTDLHALVERKTAQKWVGNDVRDFNLIPSRKTTWARSS